MSAADVPAPEQRLHPLSWLFVLLHQLQQFIVPLLVLLVAGRGDRHDLWGLLAVAVLVLAAFAESLTYRYAIGAQAITIRRGWLHRTRRELPFARIHNVSLHQSPLHRLFGVAEVRLESAGGAGAEARMRVLRLDQALALEALVRRQRGQAGSAEDSAPPLLTLTDAELVRLGLISNRGLLVVAAAFGALSQAGENVLYALFERWGRWALDALGRGLGRHLHDGPLALGLAAFGLLLAVVVGLRLLSVLLALVQFHGFTLREEDGRLQVERGLLARTRTAAPLRRIQAWRLRESLLHRLFHRCSLGVDTAATPHTEDAGGHPLREIAPIATPARCRALLQHFLPGLDWDGLAWQPLHPRAWRLLAGPGVLLVLASAGLLAWRIGPMGALALVLLPLALWRARRLARACAWACDGRHVAWRSGWLDHRWHLAEIAKLQALQLRQSPLQRRLGMASLLLDTAGGGAHGTPLLLRHLPQAEARALSARLVAQMVGRGRQR
ncbi:PH domain-containing protein [Thermomonas flagellata]|uniref:PH domain-containing protein n=1 Tax=Thermomonas flagellata TaxID=2888524 RepID=UPI001F049B64|nr:PH domain-containing protein [Thermomonas flagellata]